MKIMVRAIAPIICFLCGLDGVFMGFFNLDTPHGLRFAPWDFILGGLLLGMGIGLSLCLILEWAFTRDTERKQE